MHARLTVSSALALVAAITAFPAAAVQRTFVASYGSDANTATNCGFANPCRGLTAAQTVTDSGGEIVALDAAGFGAITITKSLSIVGNPGVFAGIAASSGDAVAIATPGLTVTLRNLNLNGLNSATFGVNVTANSSVLIDNCVIYNFTFSGVDASVASHVRIVNTMLRNNGNYGVRVDGGATLDVSKSTAMSNGIVGFYTRAGAVASVTTTASYSDSVVTGSSFGWAIYSTDATTIARATITRSSSTNNGEGIWNNTTAGSAFVTVSYSMSTFNSSSGFFNGAGGTFYTQSNNTVHQNATNVNGALAGAPGI
jgi:hypothetical protein